MANGKKSGKIAHPVKKTPHILKVHQRVTLSQHGRLSVEEEIVFDGGNSNGVFTRYVPTLYKRAGKLQNLTVNVKGAFDQNGQPIPFRSKAVQAFEGITVGDSTHSVSGLGQIRLSYDVIGAVNQLTEPPELIYDVLGPEWTRPIDKVGVDLTLAPGQGTLAKRAIVHVGGLSSKVHAPVTAGGGGVSFGSSNLPAGQDLILVMPLPTGAIAKSTIATELREADALSSMAYILPGLTLIALVILWFFFGSDQRLGKKPTLLLKAPWQPPADMTAVECGTIVDESCDDKDILATTIALAERGYLAVREVPNHGLTGFGNKDYEFSQPPIPVKGELKDYEEFFLNVLFNGKNKVYLSTMQGYLIDYLPILRRMVQKRMTGERWFARNPQADRDHFINAGIFSAACGALLFAYCIFVSDVYKMVSIGLIVSGVLTFMWSAVMPKRTRKGVAAVEQIHKFEHFILHASDKEIAAAYDEDPEVFYRLLPYALVLGMGEFWADRFRGHVTREPRWYSTMEAIEGRAGFDCPVFTKDVVHCLKAVQEMARTHPEKKHISHSR